MYHMEGPDTRLSPDAMKQVRAHLHLKGSRMTAAFLLKGPARFVPMGLNHLGKNNDQIVRRYAFVQAYRINPEARNS